MADITGSFSAFLYGLSTEIKRFVEKQRKDIETIVKTELEPLGAFLCSVRSNLS